jgi:hypothetical protein
LRQVAFPPERKHRRRLSPTYCSETSIVDIEINQGEFGDVRRGKIRYSTFNNLLYWPFIGKVLADIEHYFRILKMMSVPIVLFMFLKFFYCSQDIYKFVLKLF